MTVLKKITRNLFLNRYVCIMLGASGSGLILLGLIWLLLFYGTDSPGRNELFIGRLHPVVVHLPIGVLLAVFLYEFTSVAYPDLRNLPVTLFLIWVGFFSAAVSALAGFYLSLTGGYDPSYLFWHKWLGLLVAGTSGFCFLFAGLEYLNKEYRMYARRYRNIYRSILLCMVVMLFITGHLGGTLTHGPGYITEYLPKFVRGSLGLSASSYSSDRKKIQDIQKAEIYGDLVKPVLKKRCVSCHGPSKKKGDLRLDTKEGIKKGGENGKIIEPGKPEKSELVRRITLPLYHEEVMPPDDREPLSIGNTELIRWWIATGASFEKTVSEVESDTIPPAVKTKFDRISAKPEPDRLEVYETDVPAVDQRKVERLRQSTSWKLSFLSDEARFLEVRYAPDGKEELKKSDLNELKPVRKQLVWLDLSERKLTDDAWAVLEKFPLLNRLYAQRTNIRDRHLKHLSEHKYLVYLNIHHTDISYDGLQHLKLENLEKLYVWRTNISGEDVKKLKKTYSDLSIEEGITKLDGGPTTDTKETGIVKEMRSETDGTFKINPDGIDEGTLTYSDKNFTFTNVPDKLRGKMYILTPNKFRKKKKGEVPESLLTLNLKSPATVYLAYDTRPDSKPNWLTENYKKTDMTLGLTQFPDFKFRMYKRDVPAGEVTFGANAPDDYESKDAITMFSVVLASKSQ